jgi:hypothetical protein
VDAGTKTTVSFWNDVDVKAFAEPYGAGRFWTKRTFIGN